jgi:hypothetical protein
VAELFHVHGNVVVDVDGLDHGQPRMGQNPKKKTEMAPKASIIKHDELHAKYQGCSPGDNGSKRVRVPLHFFVGAETMVGSDRHVFT